MSWLISGKRGAQNNLRGIDNRKQLVISKMVQRLRKVYYRTVVPRLEKQFQYGNKLEIPRVEKIVINRGVGEGWQNS